MSQLHCLILLMCICYTAAQFNLDCKITAKFRNDGHKKVRIDVLIPSLSSMSDPIILSEYKEMKSVDIKGHNCEKKHWVFLVYGWENNKWVLRKKSKAKFTGHGWFLATIEEHYEVNVLDRLGIMCSEGNCG